MAWTAGCRWRSRLCWPTTPSARWHPARSLHQRSGQPNLLIKIPGTKEGLPAIEAAIFAGIPVNVTLLFSSEQYTAAAEAYLRGVERRIEAGLNPAVASVASVFVSRWDVAVAGKVPSELTNRLGIAVAQRTYRAYRELLASARFQRVANCGGRAQRLLWASTGTKDPKAPDILYVKALAAPFTVNTMPEATLKAFGDHGDVGATLAVDGGDCEGCWRALPRRALTSMRWPPAFRTTGPRPSSSPGTT
jgi:transaldolase